MIVSLSKKLLTDLTKDQVVELVDILSTYLIRGSLSENPELSILQCDEKSIRSFGDSQKFGKDVNINLDNVPVKTKCNDEIEMYRMKITANKIINRQCGFDKSNDSKDNWTDDCLRNIHNIITPRSLKPTRKVPFDEDNETCSSKISNNDLITSRNYNNTYNKQNRLPNPYLNKRFTRINIDTKKRNKNFSGKQNSNEFYSNQKINEDIILKESHASDCNISTSLLFRKILLFPNINDNKKTSTSSNCSQDGPLQGKSEDYNSMSGNLSKAEQPLTKDNEITENILLSKRRLNQEMMLQMSQSNRLTRRDSINSFRSKLRYIKSVNSNVHGPKYEAMKFSTNFTCNVCHLHFPIKKGMSLHNCKTQFHI